MRKTTTKNIKARPKDYQNMTMALKDEADTMKDILHEDK